MRPSSPTCPPRCSRWAAAPGRCSRSWPPQAPTWGRGGADLSAARLADAAVRLPAVACVQAEGGPALRDALIGTAVAFTLFSSLLDDAPRRRGGPGAGPGRAARRSAALVRPPPGNPNPVRPWGRDVSRGPLPGLDRRASPRHRAPPLARRLGPATAALYPWLARVRPATTHLVGVARRPAEHRPHRLVAAYARLPYPARWPPPGPGATLRAWRYGPGSGGRGRPGARPGRVGRRTVAAVAGEPPGRGARPRRDGRAPPPPVVRRAPGPGPAGWATGPSLAKAAVADDPPGSSPTTPRPAPTGTRRAVRAARPWRSGRRAPTRRSSPSTRPAPAGGTGCPATTTGPSSAANSSPRPAVGARPTGSATSRWASSTSRSRTSPATVGAYVDFERFATHLVVPVGRRLLARTGLDAG